MRSIPGFDGYYALCDGTIVGRWGRPLSTYRDRDGYKRVTIALARGKDATRVHKGVHQLVCMAFHGAGILGDEVRHIDGVKDNNTPSNLCWGTRQQNSDDRFIHGTVPRGERHPMAKLSAADVRDIRLCAQLGIPTRDVATAYGVSRDMVNRIKANKNWRNA